MLSQRLDYMVKVNNLEINLFYKDKEVLRFNQDAKLATAYIINNYKFLMYLKKE
jgi:hypothetical protein